MATVFAATCRGSASIPNTLAQLKETWAADHGLLASLLLKVVTLPAVSGSTTKMETVFDAINHGSAATVATNALPSTSKSMARGKCGALQPEVTDATNTVRVIMKEMASASAAESFGSETTLVTIASLYPTVNVVAALGSCGNLQLALVAVMKHASSSTPATAPVFDVGNSGWANTTVTFVHR